MRRNSIALIAACGLALAAASCGGAGTDDLARKAIGAGGGTIPAKAESASPPESTSPTATTGGEPRVAQFRSPRRFWCLEAHPGQAQVIVGWSVPSAKKVTVRLDGRRLHTGIRKKLPFWVPAGDASGIGGTVVFGCGSGERHRVAVRWRKPSSPPVERAVTIEKAPQG